MTDAHRDITTAYDGVEDLSGFDPAALAAYRAELLERTAAQSDFVARRLPPGARVVEVGSGNGRLLIDLARRGAVREAVGLEVSASRVAFARAWTRELGIAAVEHRCEDALTAELGTGLDAVLCITGAFAYFDAIEPGAGATLLRRARAALHDDGLLVLELYPHPQWRALLEAGATGELRVWRELEPSDPWRFYLSDLAFDAATGVLTHRKVFIHRDSGAVDDSRREHLRLFDADGLTAELAAAGFGAVELHGDWSGRPHAPADEVLIATARAARVAALSSPASA